MSTELIVALIAFAGVIASAIISTIVSRYTAKTHSWASAASDGRLRAQQQAYEICWDLYYLLNSYDNGVPLKGKGDIIGEIRESRKSAREWWKIHCVYLDKRIKSRFWNCLHLALKYEIGIFENKRRCDQEMQDIHDAMWQMLHVIGTSLFRSNYRLPFRQSRLVRRFWPFGKKRVFEVAEDVLMIHPKH